MKITICDICGEEIKRGEQYSTFELVEKPEIIRVDAHNDCYKQLVYRVKRCIDGEKYARQTRQ